MAACLSLMETNLAERSLHQQYNNLVDTRTILSFSHISTIMVLCTMLVIDQRLLVCMTSSSNGRRREDEDAKLWTSELSKEASNVEEQSIAATAIISKDPVVVLMTPQPRQKTISRLGLCSRPKCMKRYLQPWTCYGERECEQTKYRKWT